MPDWRVDVRDFGRVAEASIEMAPLVVLVGRNNSGKSYVASLLWSLLNIDESWLDRQGDAPDWFQAFLKRQDAQETVDPVVLENWLNRALASAKDRVARTLLSYDGATIGNVQLTLSGVRKCRFRREPAEGDNPDYVLTRTRSPQSEAGVEVRYTVGGGRDASLEPWVNATLLGDLVEAALFGFRTFPMSRPIYLPAARTGLMLSLPFIVGDLLGALGLDRDQRQTSRLPQPTIQFLRQVVSPNGRPRAELVKIADFLERELLRGSVARDEATSPTFSYTPDQGQPMPLHTASSMVSELAPFLLLLRSLPLDRGLIFEEPESHLHLSAQRQVARAIARLINLGVPVVVTTHSDTFLQQINILIALYSHPEREILMEQYGYSSDDLISPIDVRGYEFLDGDKGRSEVRPVEMIESGLVVTSLNDVLIELSEEAIATQDR